MLEQVTSQAGRQDLAERFRRVRAETERLCAPLAVDDYQIQSITETSPPKWHLAHVSWFFEAFVLPDFQPGYVPFHPRYAYLFNSYYETVGRMQPRAQRGLLSRPSVEEVYRYRRHVDEQVLQTLPTVSHAQWADFAFRITLGLNHEQQHQELLLMDIKHNLSVNPLRPAYRDDLVCPDAVAPDLRWIERPGGIHSIGLPGTGTADAFCFDNETPCHEVLLPPHRLASRLVTNEEYLAFMADAGYTRPELWLADGWYLLQREGWRQPLYWSKAGGQQDDEWEIFTLGGLRRLNPHQPVCHLSCYEADAYARWAGKRLPTEAELELMLAEQPLPSPGQRQDVLQPQAGDGQWYGEVWQWTASPYAPYPGFRPLVGSMGEYNGKFMCNQMTLRGSSCVTPAGHARPSYRNFFYPHDRWPVTGLRLAEDA
jgi:ergothioneine biosynthesis protein EgtB